MIYRLEQDSVHIGRAGTSKYAEWHRIPGGLSTPISVNLRHMGKWMEPPSATIFIIFRNGLAIGLVTQGFFFFLFLTVGLVGLKRMVVIRAVSFHTGSMGLCVW